MLILAVAWPVGRVHVLSFVVLVVDGIHVFWFSGVLDRLSFLVAFRKFLVLLTARRNSLPYQRRDPFGTSHLRRSSYPRFASAGRPEYRRQGPERPALGKPRWANRTRRSLLGVEGGGPPFRSYF